MSNDALARLERWCSEDPDHRTVSLIIRYQSQPTYSVKVFAGGSGYGYSTILHEAVSQAIDEWVRETTSAAIEPSRRARGMRSD